MAHTPEALEAHLRDDLIPWWRDHGVDRAHGGFHETLRPDGTPGPESERRLRTLTRLLYAFGVGARLDVPGARALADTAYAQLRRVYGDPEHGGFYRTATADGAPLDRTKDTYDHAFAVLALTEYHASCGAPDALALAAETAGLVRSQLGDGVDGGYLERAAPDWTPQRSGSRHQNPQMHWVEALLALHAGTGDERWREEADALVALCAERFVDPHTGTLGEVFGPRWEPLQAGAADAPQDAIVEPGHHYEWVWLLARYEASGGTREVGPLSDRLFGFAESAGLDARGLVLDGVAPDGRPRRRTHRLWPQTERMKALAVRGELESLGAFLELAFGAYAAPAGGWHEELGPDGAATDARQRATSVYHLVLGLLEAGRALAGRG
jgi:mannose/cellobiose epimerase-like protein (N-acyl-D-glucosamine 2-epimerase family)